MPIPAARDRTIADALVAKITAIWSPTAPDAVERTYLPDVYSADDIQVLSGRQIRVASLGKKQIDRVDRNTTRDEYEFLVLVLERYTGAGDPTRDWTDERNDFVADLADQLGDEDQQSLLGSDYPDRVDTPSPADDVMLREHKLFWSAFTIAIRECT
ncbi:MAG: hypothetical protein KF873_02000 [Gemmataceae bacterium]|nr:hypothetical protein [Gemmataceae bacterium]